MNKGMNKDVWTESRQSLFHKTNFLNPVQFSQEEKITSREENIIFYQLELSVNIQIVELLSIINKIRI